MALTRPIWDYHCVRGIAGGGNGDKLDFEHIRSAAESVA
jgi:hypothetical protein